MIQRESMIQQVETTPEEIQAVFSETDRHTLVTFGLRIKELKQLSMHTLIGTARKVKHCCKPINRV